MATVADILTSVRYDIMDEDVTQYTDAMLTDYLNRSVRVLDRVLTDHNSDLVFATTTKTLADDASYVALPTDFGSMARKKSAKPVTYGSDYNEIYKLPIDELFVEREEGAEGAPQYYSEYKTDLYFDKTADQDYTITIRYNKKTGTLTTASTMPYNGEFNDSIIKAVAVIAKNRNEYSVAGEGALYQFFLSAALGYVVSRNNTPRIKLGF